MDVGHFVDTNSLLRENMNASEQQTEEGATLSSHRQAIYLGNVKWKVAKHQAILFGQMRMINKKDFAVEKVSTNILM